MVGHLSFVLRAVVMNHFLCEQTTSTWYVLLFNIWTGIYHSLLPRCSNHLRVGTSYFFSKTRRRHLISHKVIILTIGASRIYRGLADYSSITEFNWEEEK
jgi:hypothetical protein